ncbi:MAG: hypothetical protein R2710_26750 [Acidimicrobiales bacterium]
MADWLDASPDGIEVSLGQLVPCLGISAHFSRNTPVVRTMTRLVDFGIASIGGDTFGLRTILAPLPLRHVRKLPPGLASRHELELEQVR